MSAVNVKRCPTAAYNGVYCQSTLEYYNNGAWVPGGTRYSYVHRSDATRKVFYETRGTSSRWVLAKSYNGFNEETLIVGSDTVPPTGVWRDNLTTTIYPIDCSSSSSSSSISFSSSCSCSCSSSSLDATSVDAFKVTGLVGWNGAYCAAGTIYFHDGAWVSGGTRFFYVNEDNPDQWIFYEDYDGGYWVIALNTYDVTTEAAYVLDSGTTPPTGAWGAFCTLATWPCGSSSSCSCSSSSCSTSHSNSSSSSSFSSASISSESVSFSSSSSCSSSLSLDPVSTPAFKVVQCSKDASYIGIYCASSYFYFYNGSFVAGGTRRKYVNRDSATKIMIWENFGTGRWVLCSSTYDGMNEIAVMNSADTLPPSGIWKNDYARTMPTTCDSSSCSSSSCSSSESFSSSCSCSCSSSSMDVTAVTAFRVTGTSTAYDGIYCASGGLGYFQGTDWQVGGTRRIYVHRDHPDFRVFYRSYGTGFWVLGDISYDGSNEVCYKSNSGATPPTGAWGSTCCTLATVACDSSSSCSFSSSSSSSCSCSSSSCSSSSSAS